jgi:cation diffusion facilitator CzcD-associated flavoprotein CzcO
MNRFDVIVIGGGQSGLAVGYYLRRSNLRYIILDRETDPGGAWLHTWKSLKLFSPAQWSSLPGVIMKGGSHYYPTRDEAIGYLKNYETKYHLPVKRPVEVFQVSKEAGTFVVQTSGGLFYADAVVSATGTFANPYIPPVAGIEFFEGEVLHSSQYQSPDRFAGKKIAVVGEGNSGAQILAEVSAVTETIWITQKEPRFLADDIDGRYLFDAATQMYEAQKAGRRYTPPSLGDIVMVDVVKEARSRNVLKSVRPFHQFTKNSLVWADGHTEKIDVVIFCTGFNAALKHLTNLGIVTKEGKVETSGTKAKEIEGLWLVGYGNWTGFASATLIGVGRTAKSTVDEIVNHFIISHRKL